MCDLTEQLLQTALESKREILIEKQLHPNFSLRPASAAN